MEASKYGHLQCFLGEAFPRFAAVLLPEQEADQGSETSKRRKPHAVGFARVKREVKGNLCVFFFGWTRLGGEGCTGSAETSQNNMRVSGTSFKYSGKTKI